MAALNYNKIILTTRGGSPTNIIKKKIKKKKIKIKKKVFFHFLVRVVELSLYVASIGHNVPVTGGRIVPVATKPAKPQCVDTLQGRNFLLGSSSRVQSKYF